MVINSTLTSLYSLWNPVSFVKFLFPPSEHYLNGHNCLQWTQQHALKRKLSYYSYFRERLYTNRRGDCFGRARGAEGLEVVREWLWSKCSALYMDKIIMKPITLYDKCILIIFEYCEWMPPFLPALRHVLRSGSPGRDSLGILSSVSQPQASGLSLYFPDNDCNEFHDFSVRVPVLICGHSLYHILQRAYGVYMGSKKPKYL